MASIETTSHVGALLGKKPKDTGAAGTAVDAPEVPPRRPLGLRRRDRCSLESDPLAPKRQGRGLAGPVADEEADTDGFKVMPQPKRTQSRTFLVRRNASPPRARGGLTAARPQEAQAKNKEVIEGGGSAHRLLAELAEGEQHMDRAYSREDLSELFAVAAGTATES